MELVNPAGKGFFNLRKSHIGCQPVYTEQKAALDRFTKYFHILWHFWFVVQENMKFSAKEKCPGSKVAHQDCWRGAGPSAWWSLIGTPSRLYHLIQSLINPLDKSTEGELCWLLPNTGNVDLPLPLAEWECGVKLQFGLSSIFYTELFGSFLWNLSWNAQCPLTVSY